MNTKIADDRWDWVGIIETYTGIKADIFDLTHDMLDIEDIANSLAHICRYGGHVPHFYSVAEHSVHVANWLEDFGYDKQTIITGLLHDAAEAYVGDMVRPLKRHPEFGKYHQQIENEIAQKIHEKFGGKYPHPDIIHEADRHVYNWEVEYIRTAEIIGMQPADAKELFIYTYNNYTGNTQ